MAIKCFVDGCYRDVIGQCGGNINEHCGHFYCALHSKDRVCDECAVIADRDKLTTIYNTAVSDVNSSGKLGCALFFIYVLVIPIILYNYIDYFEAMTPMGIAVLVIAYHLFYIAIARILINSAKNRKKKIKAKQLELFDNYYDAHRRRRAEEMMAIVGSLAAANLFRNKVTMHTDQATIQNDIWRIKKSLINR